MAELKYTYALDKNENCIGIENAQKGIEYRCPHCKGCLLYTSRLVSGAMPLAPIQYP